MAEESFLLRWVPSWKICFLKKTADFFEFIFPIFVKKSAGFVETFYFPPSTSALESERKSVIEFTICLEVVLDAREAVLHFVAVMVVLR